MTEDFKAMLKRGDDEGLAMAYECVWACERRPAENPEIPQEELQVALNWDVLERTVLHRTPREWLQNTVESLPPWIWALPVVLSPVVLMGTFTWASGALVEAGLAQRLAILAVIAVVVTLSALTIGVVASGMARNRPLDARAVLGGAVVELGGLRTACACLTGAIVVCSVLGIHWFAQEAAYVQMYQEKAAFLQSQVEQLRESVRFPVDGVVAQEYFMKEASVVRSLTAGEVVFAGDLGNDDAGPRLLSLLSDLPQVDPGKAVVILESDGDLQVYAPLRDVRVQRGEHVDWKSVIGNTKDRSADAALMGRAHLCVATVGRDYLSEFGADPVLIRGKGAATTSLPSRLGKD